MYPQYETGARLALSIAHPPVASVAALALIPAEERADGMECICTADASTWVFSAASTAADATSQLVVTPSVGAGAWLRADKAIDLKLAVAFGTADAAVLFTVPTGYKLQITQTYWEVTTPFTGGASSAIGASSSNAGYNTKGDLQGGASGDLAAALTPAGYKGGTIGAKFASNGKVVLVATDTVKFDRITSAFTAGAGFLHLEVQVIQ